MSDQPLYQINRSYHDKTKFRFIDNAIAEGLLVPVEPDYEAAGLIFGKRVEPMLKDGGFLQWEWVKEAVDAALGEPT